MLKAVGKNSSKKDFENKINDLSAIIFKYNITKIEMEYNKPKTL